MVRSVLVTFSLGYAPLLYWVFGDKTRDVYYTCPRTSQFWIDTLVPIYWDPRGRSAGCVSGAAWF